MPANLPSRRALVEFLLKAGITVGLLCFLLYRVNFRMMAGQIASVGFGAFSVSVLIILLLSGLMSLRWDAIQKVMGCRLSLMESWRIVIIGMFFNQTLPSSIGGDAVRIWLFSRRGAGTLRAGFISVALDRLFALIAVGICIWVALPLMLKGPEAGLALVIAVMALACSIILFGLDAMASRLAPMLSGLPRSHLGAMAARLAGLARELSRVFAQLLRRPAAGGWVLAISVVNQLALGLVIFIFAWALGTGLSLANALLLFPLAMLLTMIPISLGGWGVREVAMVWLFGTVGVHAQEALSISVLFGLTTTSAGLPGGVLWLMDRRSNGGKTLLTEASEDAAPRIVGQSEIRVSPWVTVRERRIDFGDGRLETYHSIAQADYIAIVAVTPDGRIPMVRQYRPAIDRFTWELPAGMVDPDEPPLTTCLRELREETGLVGIKVHPLGVFAADFARLGNHIHSFLVETEIPTSARSELEVRYVSFDELRQHILAGAFDLQYHVAAIGLALLRPELAAILRATT